MPVKLVLMPGMDGSGKLFREFVAALLEGTAVQTLRYPTDRWVPYRELAMELVRVMPSEPFVLVAESYSVPLAVVVASMRPEGLRGMVLFAGLRGLRELG
jgi:pimeloyl-[acyl-carrier protein] methyl ester esterase